VAVVGVLAVACADESWACACGCSCSAFDVGGTSGLPIEGDQGGRVFVEWDRSNQNRNWSGTFDRDTDLGSGSTDLILGGFHRSC
jgi:hypothetical protein